MANVTRVHAFGLDRKDFEESCRVAGVSPIHAGPFMRFIYKGTHPQRIPPSLKSWADRSLDFSLPEIDRLEKSAYDSSVKFLLKFADGERVEAVLMPESNRVTICLSTQVGCAQACSFCHTGRLGLTRNMTAGEIVAQLQLAQQWIDQNPLWLQNLRLPPKTRVSNIVFMGMGEPLDNVESVIKAIRIVTDQYTFELAAKRVSVSTAGHLDGLRVLVNQLPKVSLALSLHNAFDQQRSKIMPINKRWPLREVLDFLRGLDWKGRCVMIQYTLIANVNDSSAHAQELMNCLKTLPVKINIIPLNPFLSSRLRGPDQEALYKFRDILHQGGYRVMVRYSKGQDIAAACGQLALVQ